YGKEGEDSSRWMKRYECFRKACKWSDSEATDYLDLFLEGRSLNWYKGFTINNKDWETVKLNFLEVFADKDEEITAWNELIKFDSTGKDSIEISGLLTHLFSKAKISNDHEKLKYLMKSLEPSKRRKDKDLKEINCVDLNYAENELFVSEKRQNNEIYPEAKKKSRGFDDVSEIGKVRYKDHPKIQSRKPAVIKLSSNFVPYSIGNDLANTKVDLPYSQLLQVAPSVKNELLGLCKMQDTKELNHVDYNQSMNTNCRGLIKLFNERYWAVLDTGAACSVISSGLMNEIGLEIDDKDTQTVVTADGSRYNAVIDLKFKELVLEKPEVDVVMKLYTSKPNKRFYDEFEVFGIGLQQTDEIITEKAPEKEIEDTITKFQDIFATDITKLTQTNVKEHSIDTGYSQPVRLYPYRIPHALKQKVRSEIDKMEKKGL
ncbi:hypothetical protein AYI70_g9772, partial [Smittium culicis]